MSSPRLIAIGDSKSARVELVDKKIIKWVIRPIMISVYAQQCILMA